ncbi:hypothetical protein [Paenibacillus ginsengarvi]|uniref:Uncharacterized protein n=1 Tax=Paenibacillus ginsengarvi TaxID=400777 RepID=A0A3B0CD68_9BACL|nr:hypothetical protein [Paenibacillus ginsengarvi]RKN84155.1 hypothetical protein D7M11_14180 [Paenibacillus ginsengarvi]
MWKSRAGSVSISLILLIAPLFTFHAALIDAARVQMGERQAETATKTALRSVLSAYDPTLRGYGLFAVGLNPAASSDLFEQVLTENLNTGGNGSFSVVQPSFVSAKLQPLYTLGNQSVFGRQVLEEMKYRAPVEFALGVTDKLTGKSGAASMLGGVSQFAKQAGNIETLIEQRDDELDAAWSASREAVAKASTYEAYYAKKLERLDELCRLIGLRTAEDLNRDIRALKAQADSLQQAIRERQAGLAGLLQAGVQAVEQLIAIQQAIGELERKLGDIQKQIGDLELILRYIAEYTLLMNTTKLEAERDRIAMSDRVSRIFEKLDRAKSLDDQIRAELTVPADSGIAVDALAAATMPDSYYVKYKTGAGGLGALFSGFETALSVTALFVGENKFDSARKQDLDASNEAYGQKAQQFAAEQGAEENKRTAAKDSVSKRKKEEKLRYAQIWDELRKIWADCGSDSTAAYARLEVGDPASGEVSLNRKYADYNRIESAQAAANAEMGDSDTAIQKTTGLIDKLLGGIGSAAGQFRDELYYNEYALTKFNYRTYGKEIGPDGYPKPDYESSQRESHELETQEAEYLIYGLNSCLKNQSAAYAEMFAIRLAVRTAEALMAPESKVVTMGNPLLTLLWALAEGAGRAYVDMTKLVSGEEVQVSDKTPAALTMNYKDYLRLFLMLHTKREPMMTRMQSLIELNTNQDLRQSAAYMQVRTETRVGLWFMPFTLSAFGYPVQGNQAQVTKSAMLSY